MPSADRRGRALAVLCAVAFASLLLPAGAAASVALSVTIAHVIDPSAAQALERVVEEARRKRAAMVIVRLDTPGGLGESMRAMVRTIASAPMPVVVYVHPGGARADSAGVMLTLAADVAAMTPQTNIGSATPVWAGPPPRSSVEEQRLRDMRRKAINDGAALARTLAESHARNADLAERMVRRAENVTAVEARREGLVDVLAPSEPALLRALDGFRIKGPKARRLRTSGLRVEPFAFDDVVDATGSDDVDRSSVLRSFAVVFGGAAALALAVTGVRRAGPPWRRWRRRRRRARLQKRRSAARH